MRTLTLLLLLCSFSLSASELEHHIQQLNDDDFDVRQAAEEWLSNCDGRFASAFLRLAGHTQPEVEQRLTRVAYHIIQRRQLIKHPTYLRAMGSIGINWRNWYTEETHKRLSFSPYTMTRPDPDGLGVLWVKREGPSDGRLMEDDVILEIDGHPAGKVINCPKHISQSGWVIPGRDYSLMVYRESDNTLFLTTVHATTVDSWDVNHWAIRECFLGLWDRYQAQNRFDWLDCRYRGWARRLGLSR